MKGGASTHLQVLSIESQKYFNNAIALSGTSENSFAFNNESNLISLAYKVANGHGKLKNSTDDLIEYYKTATVKELMDTSDLLITRFLPTIESLLLFCFVSV